MWFPSNVLILVLNLSIQFGKVCGTSEVDTSLRPKVKKDIHKLLQKAQKKQEYIKQLESTESGKVKITKMRWFVERSSESEMGFCYE